VAVNKKFLVFPRTFYLALLGELNRGGSLSASLRPSRVYREVAGEKLPRICGGGSPVSAGFCDILKHMKLILASNGNTIFNLLPKIVDQPINQLKIGWVTTAAKGVEDLTYLKTHRQIMRKTGWNFAEIDIENKSPKQLKKIFADKDIIHIEGGNTFYLLKAVRKTGFDKIIKELIDRGVTYAGTSAGSYIMCPTIEMSTWKPKPKPRFGLKDLTALNYVPFLLSVHYDPKNKELLKKAIRNTEYPVRILTDGQALLIQDDKVTFIGRGKEVKLK